MRHALAPISASTRPAACSSRRLTDEVLEACKDCYRRLRAMIGSAVEEME
jgi:hypothetical protein